MHVLSDDEIVDMRRKSYDIWDKEFNTVRNASDFVEFLDRLLSKE